MNLLLVSHIFPPPVFDGMARYAENLATGLSEAGHNVFVLSGFFNNYSVENHVIQKNSRLLIHRYQIINRLKYRPEPWQRFANLLESKVKKYHIDLIVIQHPYHGAAASFVSKKMGCPLIYICHTPAALDRIIRKGEKNFHHNIDNEEREHFTVSNSDAVICVSESLRQLLIRLYKIKSDSVHFIPTGVTPLKAGSSKTISALLRQFNLKEKKLILFVGRESWEKGTDFLPDIIKQTTMRTNKAQFLLVGLERRHWARYLLLPSTCILPWLESGELAKLYDLSHILLLPSRRDSMPYVLLEAMSCDVVPVVTDVDGPGDLINHQFNGLKIPIEREQRRIVLDSRSMAEAITSLIEDERLYLRLKKNVQNSIHPEYTVENQIKEFLKLAGRLI